MGSAALHGIRGPYYPFQRWRNHAKSFQLMCGGWPTTHEAFGSGMYTIGANPEMPDGAEHSRRKWTPVRPVVRATPSEDEKLRAARQAGGGA